MSSSKTGKIMVTYFVLSVFLLATVKQSFGTMLTEYFDTAENCTSDADCTGSSPFSICHLVNLTSIDTPEETFKCVCDAQIGYYKYGNRCYYRTKFDETCDEYVSMCVTSNAECLLEGGYSSRRCRCKLGYHAVKGDGEVICAMTITKLDDGNCRACEANEGKCYAMKNDRLRSGCKCPSYRSGADCENVHLSVTCESSTFTMIICYQPHSDIPDNARLYVFGYDTVRQCEALMVKDDKSMCKQGQMALRLPLAPHLRDVCGTKETLVELVKRRFENKLVLLGDGRELTGAERAFAVYCSFQDVANTKHEGLGALAIETGKEGQYKYPQLTLRIENVFGNEIPEGTAVRLGDRVIFKLLMVNDGTFSAMRLEHCTASSRATIPNTKSITCAMIRSGCPDIHQMAFNEQNNFRYIEGRPYEIQSGLVNMFKLSEKTSFHMHCRLKICLLGHEAKCNPLQCTYPAFHYSAGRRRKRSTSANARYMMISREFFWYADKQQPKEKFSLLKEDAEPTTVKPTITIEHEVVAEVKINLMPMYVVVTVILLLVTVAIVIAAGVLFCRLRMRKVSPGFKETPSCNVPPKEIRSVPCNDEYGAPPSDVCGVPLVDVCNVTPNNICSVPPSNVNSVYGHPTALCRVPPGDVSSVPLEVPFEEVDTIVHTQSTEIISGPGNDVVAISPNESNGLPPIDFFNITITDDVHCAPPDEYCGLPPSYSNEEAEQNERLEDSSLF